jgi:RNA polymerase sigma factor (sigma-70 family)
MVRYERPDPAATAALVVAAQRGDQRAPDALLAESLPLVYNVVGRALAGHPDVDDVVQDTMLRAVGGLPGLRQPESFRSWLVAIAVRLVRNHRRAHGAVPPSLDDPDSVADPGADFVDLTIVRLGLSGQRREVAEATRWLDAEDQELLSLWWLEAAGELTRTEVVETLELSAAHVAVQIQRMKGRLDAARAVVRAMRASPRCADLAGVVATWDGRPNPLWRKRIARHTRDCPYCAPGWADQVPVERLLAGMMPVPPPGGLAGSVARLAQAVPRAHGTGRGLRRLVRPHRYAAAKPVVAALAGVAVLATAAVVGYVTRDRPAPTAAVATPSSATSPAGSVPPSPGTASPSLASASPSPVPATGPTVLPPPARSAKKGVSAWYFNGVTQALADVRASWYYNWAASRANLAAPAGVEFVPMAWGAKSVTAANLGQAKGEGHTLLGFNEPDLGDQANMSVAQALDLWPQLMSTGMRLGSPAPAYGAATAGSWLDQFMSGAAARGYRVDFIALHWYGSDFSAAATGQLRDYLRKTYERYHKPIWLTEYALINFTGTPKYPSASQQASFVTASTAMLAGLSYVERYAWFALPATNGSGTGLYVDARTPTAAGVAYRAAG